MNDSPIRLAVVIGSVRSGRIGPAIADWLCHQLKLHAEFDVDLIDLAELDLPANLDGSGDTASLATRIAVAAAIVVVTPEYNHGYPGPLKHAIDSTYEQWRAKPVGLVSYGGMAAGLRAVEQLRPVFAELHAVTMQKTVSLRNAYDFVNDAGAFCPAARAEAAVSPMLTQLRWWASTLGAANTREPYPG